MLGLILATFLAAAAAASDAGLTEAHCDILAKLPDGKIQAITVDKLKVLEQTRSSPEFSLVVPEGYGPPAIRCLRSDIIPAENDWKVLIGGYPLYIQSSSADQLVVLELSNGQFRVRFVRGTLSPDEADRMQARLDQLQEAIQSRP